MHSCQQHISFTNCSRDFLCVIFPATRCFFREMEEVVKKSVSELSQWLEHQGYSKKVAEAFEDNEVDGEAFMILSDKEIESLVKPLGPRRKLIEKQRLLKDDAIVDLSGTSTSHSDTFVVDDDSISDYNSEEEANDDQQDSSPDVLSFTCDSQVNDDNLGMDCEEIVNEEEKAHQSTQLDGNKDLPKFVDKLEKVQRVKRRKIDEPPLPEDFQLPRNFSKNVQEGLNKKNLIGRARAKFISSVASSILCHKMYPTREEYTKVAKLIVAKYPCLSIGGDCGHEYLIPALQDKMKYLRNYSGKPHQGKEKASDKLKFTATFPKPPVSASHFPIEDRAAVERHLKLLQKEEKKVNPSSHIVTELMEKTFCYRRDKLVQESEEAIPVAKIIETYPSLARPRHLLLEFNKIMEQNMTSLFEKKWVVLQDNILTLSSLEEGNNNIAAILDIAGDKMSEDSKCLAALCCLHYLIPDTRIKPDHQRIVNFVPDNFNMKGADLKSYVKVPQPCAIVRGSLETPKDVFLVVEKIILAKINAVQLPLLLLASFYVFHMHFTPGFTNLFTFLELHLLDRKVPRGKTKIAHLMAQLNNI